MNTAKKAGGSAAMTAWVVVIGLAACGCGRSKVTEVDASGGGGAGGNTAVGQPDAGGGATAPAGKLTVVPLSATGHDRFFQVVLGRDDEIFAVGVVAPGTDATADYATVVAKLTPGGALDTRFGAGGLDCNSCHTQAGDQGAPGRIVAP